MTFVDKKGLKRITFSNLILVACQTTTENLCRRKRING